MKKTELKAIVANGEGSRLQFKQDIRNVDALAAEMVAFSNVLPYWGLGSGIKRALDAWPEIDFADDRDGCLFTVTVHRKAETSSGKMDVPSASLGKTSGKTSGKIMAALKQDENLTIPELASLIGVTERSLDRNIKKNLEVLGYGG